MNKIIDLIYTDELVRYENIPYINYIAVNSENPILPELKTGRPVLVVGYLLAKSIYGTDQIDPLNRITKKYQLYWESSFKENPVNYFEGLFKILNKEILDIAFKGMCYINIDPVFDDISNPEDLIKKTGFIQKHIYQTKNMIYILSDKIYGVDLHAFEYFGIKPDLLEELFPNTSKTVDIDGAIFKSYQKIFPHVDFLKRYMVLLTQLPQNQQFSIN